MPSSRHNRKARRWPVVQIERLEHRLPLAGDVTAELTGSTLRLTGDNLANDVVVAAAAGGKIAVIGINTTINGGTAAFVSDKAVTSIVATFNDGDDAVGFGNSAADYAFQRQFASVVLWPVVWSEDPPAAPFDVAALQARIDNVAGGVKAFSLPGGLTMTTGDGNDSVGISGNVGGSVSVNLGSADIGNGIVIGAEVPASRVGGGVTVLGGDRNDLLAIGNVSVTGTVSASLGDGINWMVVGGEVPTPAVIGALSYRGGVDMDTVGLAGSVTVRNDVSIFTGARGDDSVGFETSDDGGTVKVLGNVVVNTGPGGDGDTVSLAGEVRGSLSVTTGGGRDAVSVSSSVAWVSASGGVPAPQVSFGGLAVIGRDLTISTGTGDDLVSIGTSTVGRNATIDAGSGDDRVVVDGMQVRRNLVIRLGEGDDSLDLKNLRAFAAFFSGGGGTNSLVTDAATRARSRILSSGQFRAGAKP